MGISKKRKMVKVVNELDGEKVVAYVYALNPNKPNLKTDFFIERIGKIPRGPNSVKKEWSLIDPNKEWAAVVSPSRGKTLRALKSYAKMVDSHAMLREIIGGKEIPL